MRGAREACSPLLPEHGIELLDLVFQLFLFVCELLDDLLAAAEEVQQGGERKSALDARGEAKE